MFLVSFEIHFGKFLLLFRALVVKWDPGPKKLEKGSPNTQKKLSLFHKKTMLFLSRFLVDFMQCSGEAFL